MNKIGNNFYKTISLKENSLISGVTSSEDLATEWQEIELFSEGKRAFFARN